MSVVTIPFSFSPLTSISSSQVDSNFTACAAAINSIDNTNIGGAGIYASQIIPTSGVRATFGGQFGYTFYPAVSNQIPLTVSGVTLQSADILDVTLTAGGIKTFSIDMSGQGQFLAGAIASVPLTVAGTSGQTADIFDVSLTSGGTKAFRVLAGGAGLFANALSVGASLTVTQQVIAGTGLAVSGTTSPSAGQAAVGEGNTGQLFLYASSNSGNVINFVGNTTTALGSIQAGGTVTMLSGFLPGNGVSFGTCGVYGGTGSPNAVVTAMNGSLWMQSDGTTGSRIWVNSSGASTAGTAWTAIAGV